MARVVINAEREKKKEKEKLLDLDGLATKYKSWTGRAPYLCLILALIDHNDIKVAYINRGDIPSVWMAVKNQNTEEAKAASVWQMMADKWNNKDFTPATASQPDWHPHYGASETITFQMMSDFLPNAEKVKERFESMMTVLKQTIPKWERSGQGEGGSLTLHLIHMSKVHLPQSSINMTHQASIMIQCSTRFPSDITTTLFVPQSTQLRLLPVYSLTKHPCPCHRHQCWKSSKNGKINQPIDWDQSDAQR